MKDQMFFFLNGSFKVQIKPQFVGIRITTKLILSLKDYPEEK